MNNRKPGNWESSAIHVNAISVINAISVTNAISVLNAISVSNAMTLEVK